MPDSKIVKLTTGLIASGITAFVIAAGYYAGFDRGHDEGRNTGYISGKRDLSFSLMCALDNYADKIPDAENYSLLEDVKGISIYSYEKMA